MEFDGVIQSVLEIHQAGMRKLIIFYLEVLKGYLAEDKTQFFFCWLDFRLKFETGFKLN